MNFLKKVQDFKLLRLSSLYSTSTVEYKQHKSEVEVEKLKKIRPFSKDMLLRRFNINMLEFPEVENNEYVDQTLTVSKEVDKLMNLRETIDRSTLISRLSASGIAGVSLPGIFIEDQYTWMMIVRLVESLSTDVDYTLVNYLPQTLIGQSILHAGNDIQQNQYLKSLAKGELKGCVAITEGLSDMVNDASICTSATLDTQSNSWILNGQKTRVFNYCDSDIVIVFAKTPAGDIAPFIVNSKSEGITHKGEKSHVDLFFTNVTVPNENILSSKFGIKLPRYLSSVNNIGVSAMCSKLTKSLVRQVNDFVCSRHIFGKPLSQFEVTQAHLVTLTADCYSTETAAYFTAGMLDKMTDTDLFIESTLARIYSLEALRRCLDLSMKIVGTNCLSDARFKALHNDIDTLIRSQVSTKLSLFHTAMESVEYMAEEIRKEKFRPFDKIIEIVGRYKIKGLFQDNLVVNSFKYNLHQRVGHLANHIYGDYSAFAKLLKTMSKTPELLDDEYCLDKVSRVLVDSYVMMAVLGRASRSIAIGLRNHDNEVRLAEIICNKVGLRIKKNVSLLRTYPDNVRERNALVGDLHEKVFNFTISEKC